MVYLSARDMLFKRGDPSCWDYVSHTWLHQGPLWTYMLAVAFVAISFNPVLWCVSHSWNWIGNCLVVYKVGSDMFSQQVGLIDVYFMQHLLL